MVRSIIRAVLTLIGLVAILLVAANAWVVSAASPYIYGNLARLPANTVGLVLGISPSTRFGHENLLFDYRVKAAARLYHVGKVKHLLLSGANPSKHYNEPRKLYQALRKAGVPDAAMTLDFAGFRTLDSVVRARRVFGLARYTIISQRYHDYRAVFLARHKGIDAIAYGRAQVGSRQALHTEAREYFARVKAVLDLYLLHTKPRYAGKLQPIIIQSGATSSSDGSAADRHQQVAPPSTHRLVPVM